MRRSTNRPNGICRWHGERQFNPNGCLQRTRDRFQRSIPELQATGDGVGEKATVEEVSRCPECGSVHLVRDYERGERVCEECGLVLSEQFIDQGPEWRAFDAQQRQRRARTGAPMTYTIHDKGLSTDISWKNKDSYGRRIPSRNRAQLYRLRKWQRRIRVSNATERNLAFALSELDRLASGMGLPRRVRETAAMIYRRAVHKNLISHTGPVDRGRRCGEYLRRMSPMQCAAHARRGRRRLARGSHRKEIGRTYRFIARELKLRLLPTSPLDYLSRFCSQLKLSGRVQSRSKELVKRADEIEV